MEQKPSFASATRFIVREGRLLERRVLASLFEGENPAGAVRALAAYANEDGGFGHGLEPDKRAPTSQPLDVEVAFQVMELLGRVDKAMVDAACDFLQTLGDGVGCLVPGALAFPRAPHWGEWALGPSLNPTAGLAAYLWRVQADHPWRDRATEFCWRELEDGLPVEAHSFGEVLSFLDAVGDRRRAESMMGAVPEALAALELFHLEPSADGYGVTPLHYAPSPASRWIGLFEPELIDRHLDALAASQCEDGGWPISWETIGPAAVQDCRAVETLGALRTLRAFGRL